jgi:predicted acylesterase/phospholipase RssA
MDLTIEPDASSFSFVDFSKAPELADAGEAAAQQALPRLRELIAEVEARVAARRQASAPRSAPRPQNGG